MAGKIELNPRSGNRFDTWSLSGAMQASLSNCDLVMVEPYASAADHEAPLTEIQMPAPCTRTEQHHCTPRPRSGKQAAIRVAGVGEKAHMAEHPAQKDESRNRKCGALNLSLGPVSDDGNHENETDHVHRQCHEQAVPTRNLKSWIVGIFPNEAAVIRLVGAALRGGALSIDPLENTSVPARS